MAPHTPVRRILASATTRRAMARSACSCTKVWHSPSAWESTGTRASRCTRSTSERPPRGISRSSSPLAPSMAATKPRSAVGAWPTAASGSPARRSPACSAAWIAPAESTPSEPPRSTTALPDFRHSAAASAPTLGRLS